VRKCRVVAHELGLTDRIELVAAAAHPINRDRNVVAQNPLGKIPTLIADDGLVLYDSRVICEYLNALANGRLVPQTGPARWSMLAEQALADGIMDAAVLVRYETVLRPEPLRWNDWITGQMEKVTSGSTCHSGNPFRRRATHSWSAPWAAFVSRSRSAPCHRTHSWVVAPRAAARRL